jgi:hypothetical protein
MLVAVLGAAACISVPPADVSEASSSGGSSGTTSMGTGMVDTSTTDPATTDPSSSGTTTSTTTGTGSTTADTATTGESNTLLFSDDFDRPDAEDLGNGWVEKTPSTYRIVDGVVVGVDNGPSYYNAVWYRPMAVAVSDIELTVRFRFTVDASTTTPQLHARIQPDVASVGSETAYIGYATSPSDLSVGSVLGGTLSPAIEAPINPPLETGVWYRLRLRVTGAGPVQLYTAVEEDDGQGGWTIRGEVSGSDNSTDAITTPGTYGVSGDDQQSEIDYDDFEAWEP